MKKKTIALMICGTAMLSAGATYSLTCMKYKRQLDFCKDNAMLLYVYDDIGENFYKKITKEDLLDNMIKGCVEACDEDFCTYKTSNMIDENAVNIESSVSRSGYAIDKNRQGLIVVTEVRDGSRAEEMGLQVGDIITNVDGIDVLENGYYKTIRKLLGKDGVTRKLHIKRGLDEELDIDFVIYNVMNDAEKTFDCKIMDDDVLYIKFMQFDENSCINIENAIEENDFKTILIDIRNNNGGEVWCANRIFDLFEKAGSRILLKHERSGKDEIYETSTDGKELECPVAVLVNGNSISAAEILAALFKDTGRGVVIGEKTYGKGIFQNRTRLENMLTYSYTAGYVYVNDLPNYDEIGVYPDVTVEMDSSLMLTDKDVQLKKALELLG